MLLSYILGVGGRNAANGQLARARGIDRSDLLEAVATMWLQLDPNEYPFARSVAGHLRAHDDRVDFFAGIDLILAHPGVADVLNVNMRLARMHAADVDRTRIGSVPKNAPQFADSKRVFRNIICQCHYQDSRWTFASLLTESLRLRGQLMRMAP